MEENVIYVYELLAGVPVIGEYLPAIVLLVAGAAGVATVLSKPKEGTMLDKVYKIINVLALNINNAKNKE